MSKRPYYSIFFLILALLFFQTSSVYAHPKRGLITSARCPFSCRDAKIPPEFCRSWQEGKICKVEDFRFPAGHQTLLDKRKTDHHHHPHPHYNPELERMKNKPLYLPYNEKHKNGLITSGRCPLSCHSLNIPKAFCRSWRQGDRCYVEDFRYPPGHRSAFKHR